ncbi:MAG: hypothetical protein K2W82_05745 [Candidatus Obscuribacterales bacterium]|nr:hypothetical protein [Candidatus Obscuribacterales bacterium]
MSGDSNPGSNNLERLNKLEQQKSDRQNDSMPNLLDVASISDNEETTAETKPLFELSNLSAEQKSFLNNAAQQIKVIGDAVASKLTLMQEKQSAVLTGDSTDFDAQIKQTTLKMAKQTVAGIEKKCPFKTQIQIEIYPNGSPELVHITFPPSQNDLYLSGNMVTFRAHSANAARETEIEQDATGKDPLAYGASQPEIAYRLKKAGISSTIG